MKIGEWLCKEGNKNAAAIIAKCLKKKKFANALVISVCELLK
ncbi:hypothetical protein HMPREF9087_2976 [Enterococcus casseliflavus ATCC 12755]|uniref:Uncharacterized protein n=1 Tax=Enterococcus casseliflavus ATCC 12755 TaxID=888066 RepID=F0ENI4_ENTCA|nr:hypothetical protein HMPREF9087_2976 [Enterococcus casseliflavus ATCC 12755]EPH61116.1 hypothetical protein D931_02793 [Enterococcus faecium 13.SD.W.09]EPH90996.1 hypothetical protein D922_02833 [Enterococcus faecalis 06-MB-DW-09]